MKFCFRTIAGLFISFSVPSTFAAQKINSRGFAADQWKDSQQIFMVICSQCHKSGIGPEIIGTHLPGAVTKVFVRKGHGTMPAFAPTEISDKDLESLSKWLEGVQK